MAFDNVKKCVQAGCLNPPMALLDMYHVDKRGQDTQVNHYHKKIGTGKNESMHG